MGWNNLTGKELARRADRVMRFARAMPGDASDTFHAAEQLDNLLNGADPEAVERAVGEARKSIRDGGLSMDRACERLMQAFGQNANGDNASRLASLFRRALASDKPIGKAFADMEQEESEIPDEREREMFSFCRRAHAAQFAREFGVEMPESEFVPAGEMDRAIKLMDSRRGLSFDRALELVRTGR